MRSAKNIRPDSTVNAKYGYATMLKHVTMCEGDRDEEDNEIRWRYAFDNKYFRENAKYAD